MSLYTYQIDIGAGWISAYPEGEWTIEMRRNEGQIFYREILQGELTFFGDDYDNITGVSDCTDIDFRILCDGSEYWVGKFSKPSDLWIDEDSCSLKVTPEVVDDYTCIMDNYETEYTFTLGGALAVQLRTCAGALLNAMGNMHLFVTNGATANSYLSYILNFATKMNCGLTIKSSFMLRDNFANGDNYAAAYGTNNYITGATNRLEYIYMQENSTVRSALGGTGCNSPRTITFKQCEDFMRNAFNAYWFIDENGDFRIEHIYYFDVAFPHSDYVNSPDLQTIISNNGKSFAYRRNKYQYDTGELYDQEKWEWQHYEGTEGTIAHGTDFAGVPIYYGASAGAKYACVPGTFKERKITTDRFWSDIYWAYQLVAAGTTSEITCPDGFCFYDVDTATNYIRCETGALSAAATINGHCSTANLQDHYHTYDRIFINGNMNSGAVVFDSAKPTQLQDEIEFTICCDDAPDPMNRFVTELGNGKVKAMTKGKNSVKVELLY